MKIDILLPSYSKYGVIDHFTHKLYEAFKRTSAAVRLIEGEEGLKQIVNFPPDLTICFNGAPEYALGEWLADHLQVPHLSWLLDPPYRYWELLQSQFIWIGCEDQFGCEMLRREDFNRYLFLPHGVEPDFFEDPDTERPYDIALFATYIDTSKHLSQWRKTFGVRAARAMDHALGESLESPSASFIEVLVQCLEKEGEGHLPELKRRALFEAFECHLKGVERIELVRLFADQGVHIFGGSTGKLSWKEEFVKHPQVVVHQELTYPQTLDAIKNTKILLNSSLKNKGGLHERIVTGIAGGALVATTDNPYVRQELGDRLLLFSWNTRRTLPEQALYFLNHPQERIQKIRAAQQIVQARHTWDVRAAQINNYFGKQGLS